MLLLFAHCFPLLSTDRRRADEAGRASIIAVTMKPTDSSRGDFLVTSAGRASSEEGGFDTNQPQLVLQGRDRVQLKP